MTKIIADTTCGLPLEELAAMGVDVIPKLSSLTIILTAMITKLTHPRSCPNCKKRKSCQKRLPHPQPSTNRSFRLAPRQANQLSFPHPPLTSAAPSALPRSLMKTSRKRMSISSIPGRLLVVWASWSKRPSSGRTRGNRPRRSLKTCKQCKSVRRSISWWTRSTISTRRSHRQRFLPSRQRPSSKTHPGPS